MGISGGMIPVKEGEDGGSYGMVEIIRKHNNLGHGDMRKRFFLSGSFRSIGSIGKVCGINGALAKGHGKRA